MSEVEQREEAVFEAALRLPPDQRAAYLDKACSGDASLRLRVEGLLGAFERAGGFLKEPAVPSSDRTVRYSLQVAEKAGDKIGRYKLLQQIGEGGCGVVYVAEQEEPIRRRVALKIIKLGMDTKQVIARFEAERQALAMMDHPNIAKVLDAGATETGRPYFVMELVRGIKITQFCDENKLSTEERLKLFVLICQAIQHAHQKGVIHRDIKPSNVLVTINDGVPVPKVIDFGIAKATAGRLTDQTVYTAFEQFIGTPAYMSPEQAVMTSVDVDTRSDIYSLGVLLYELLTGGTPFEEKELLAAGLDAMRRTIQEKEPVRPSTRLSTMAADALTTRASHRHTEPPKLIHLLRGDLDWIVMKCLEKDRKRRYETANGLAMDLQRYLENDPVVARPPTAAYRLQKLVRRNKVVVSAGVAVTLALLIGFTVSMRMFFKERDSRIRADAAAEKAQQVSHFLKEMLEGVGPSKALGRDTTMLKEILDETAERIGEELKGQQEIEAELRGVLGDVYQAIGEYEKAGEMHQAALSIWRRLQGDKGVDVGKGLSSLGQVHQSQSRMEEAESAHREAVLILTQALDDEVEAVLSARNNLAMVLAEREQFEEAEALFREVLAVRTNSVRDDENTADTFNNLAWAQYEQGDLSESERHHREALAMRQRLFEAPHPDIAATLSGLGLVLQSQGKFSESATSHVAAVEMFRRVLPAKHPDLVTALNNLALVYGAQAKWEEAEKLHREILEIREELLPPEHAFTADTLNNLAWVLQQQGKREEAEQFHRRALEMRRKLWGEHMDVVASLNGLALLLRDSGQLDEAAKNQTDAIEMFRRLNLSNPYVEAVLLNNLALILGAQKEFAQAEPLHREAIDKGSNAPPNDMAIWLNNLAAVREQRGDLDEAIELHRRALGLRRSVFEKDHPDIAASLDQLARVLLLQGKAPEAEAPAAECLDIWETRDSQSWRAFHARSLLGGSFLGQRRYEAAEPLLLDGYNGLKLNKAKIPQAGRPRIREATERLVRLYEEWGKPDEAETWRDKLE